MKTLSGNASLITGSGNSGIGHATSKEISAQGAKMITAGHNEEKLKKSASQLNILGLVPDQSQLKSMNKLVENVNKEFQKIDILLIIGSPFLKI